MSNEKGFMLIDGLLAMLCLSIIAVTLVPAVTTIQTAAEEAQIQLELHRTLYIELLSYDDREAFISQTENWVVEGGRICGKASGECIKIKK
ncbi:hypothetical protein ACFPFV_11145 [Salinicoccus siamensis]|uniref:Competence protein ComGE n=1 Tax=Salinicoccus siamensis TaxID=381830 RepID=A0ABV5Z1H6_9STAP